LRVDFLENEILTLTTLSPQVSCHKGIMPSECILYQLKILASNWVAKLILQGLLSLSSSSVPPRRDFIYFSSGKYILLLILTTGALKFGLQVQGKHQIIDVLNIPGKAGSLPKCNQYINTRPEYLPL